MSRIAPVPRLATHGIRMFRPENPIEQNVVDRLRQGGLEVAVYLVGRQALAMLAVPTPRAALQGPASITFATGARLPDERAIFNDGKAALAAIGSGPGFDARRGEWTVATRPLRASNQGCIQCHTTSAFTPKLGDALGVAMYVYRHRD